LGRRWLERLSARTIVHADADLANLDEPDRAVVIPHGDYAELAAAGTGADRMATRAELGIPAEAPVTLIFGQLRRDKGLGDVFAAAAEIPDLHVLVAGEEVGGLAAASDRLEDDRLRGRVVIREGFVSIDDAASYFAAADTVALAYRQASHSGVLMLAYGFERPVVVYPSGGLPEAVVDGETGWICPSADPDALAATLREAIAAGPEECDRRGRRGAELARARYSWDEIADRTLAVYDEVAPPASASGVC
jgi:phosphatidylinositol alpha-1,6-mannosyltransferase